MSEAMDEMARIEPEATNHVTFAATVDTSNLGAPQVRWIMEKAEQVEQRFIDYAENKEGVSLLGGQSERGYMTRFEDSHGPELVADVSECDGDVTGDVLTAAETLEDWFMDEVRDAGY